jgi:hypothetical protein
MSDAFFEDKMRTSNSKTIKELQAELDRIRAREVAWLALCSKQEEALEQAQRIGVDALKRELDLKLQNKAENAKLREAVQAGERYRALLCKPYSTGGM